MAYEVKLKVIEPQRVVSSRGVTSQEQLVQTIGELLASVWQHLQRHGVTPAGPPFTRYHRVSGDEIEIEGGMPVGQPVPGEGRVQPGTLPGGEVLATDHYGPYEKLPEAGAALDAWLAEHGRKAAGPNWEVYWTDPGQEKDPARWRTEVLKPLAPR